MGSTAKKSSKDDKKYDLLVDSQSRLDLLVAKINREGTNVDILDELGQSALMLAANLGREEVIKRLLECKPNINCLDSKGQTALHYACTAEIARLLLSSGANVLATDDQLHTPLHWSALNHNEEVLPVLIKRGANVEARDRYGRTPSHYAGSADVARALIANGSRASALDYAKLNPIHICAMTNNQEVLSVLIESGAYINASDIDGRTALHHATSGRLAELLIRAGADVNMNNKYHRTPLHEAASKNVGLVVVLIKNGAMIDARDINQSTPLHLAVIHDNLESVTILLKNKSNVFPRDDRGRTALHLAQSAEVSELLLSNGAHIDVSDKNCSTSLHYCSINGRKELAALLIAQGANVDSMNLQGQTPLHLAAHNNFEAILSILLKNRADSNVMNACGQTPLHLARSREVAKILLDAGAHIGSEDDFGNTALESTQFQDVAEVLLDQLMEICSLDGFISAVSSPRLFQKFEKSILTSIKLKALGLPANKTNKKAASVILRTPAVGRFNSITEFVLKCQREVDSLKSHKPTGSLTLYEILQTRNARYTHNKTLLCALQSLNYVSIYPLYGHLVSNKLEQDKLRSRLIPIAGQKFKDILQLSRCLKSDAVRNLPDSIIEIILTLLNLNDLEKLIGSFP